MRRTLAFVSVFAAFFFLFAFTVWWNGRAYARVSLSHTYYLLVRACEEETAVSVSTQVYLAGGAGYLIETGGKNCVVLSGYKKERDAQFVQRVMEQKDVVTQIIAAECGDFVLAGGDAAYAERIKENAATLDSNIWLLYDIANGLERSEISQETARAGVRGVVSSVGGLRQNNEGGIFDRWNSVLLAAERKGREIASGIIFAKDVRYLQVQLIAANVAAEEFFT